MIGTPSLGIATRCVIVAACLYPSVNSRDTDHTTADCVIPKPTQDHRHPGIPDL